MQITCKSECKYFGPRERNPGGDIPISFFFPLYFPSFLIGQLGNHKDAKVRVIIRSLVYLLVKVTYQGDLGVSSCCKAVSTLTPPLPTEREHLGVS